MPERPDPFVPILASAVLLVVVAAVGLHFYPRVSHWLEARSRDPVAQPLRPDDRVPVWVCRGVAGVAMLIDRTLPGRGTNGLAEALGSEPRWFLRLSVYNFAGADPFVMTVPSAGLDSPEGGPPALPVAALVRAEGPARLRPILAALGVVDRLEVARGHTGTLLLAVTEDPAPRSSFVLREWRFERRQLARETLAAWRLRPSWKGFEDF